LRKRLLKGRIQSGKKTSGVFLSLHSFANVDAAWLYSIHKYFNRLVGWVRLIQESGAKWAYTVRLAKFLDVCARASMISFSAHCKLLRSCMPRSRVIGVIKRANLLAADAILHSKYGRVFSRGRR
jgi:hypothetical protein